MNGSGQFTATLGANTALAMLRGQVQLLKVLSVGFTTLAVSLSAAVRSRGVGPEEPYRKESIRDTEMAVADKAPYSPFSPRAGRTTRTPVPPTPDESPRSP